VRFLGRTSPPSGQGKGLSATRVGVWWCISLRPCPPFCTLSVRRHHGGGRIEPGGDLWLSVQKLAGLFQLSLSYPAP
jgi:hypothetical protein